jgi:glucosamine 6-phosphate synthetase-like amidotransferase/phosphosugar isomerase protein
MCGIAGYSLSSESSVDRTLAAQALLAGIAERGADAAGYAHRNGCAEVSVHKQRSGASALIQQVELPQETTQVLVHVRDYTKGHPTIESNNHPIRHGSVVGVHNGVIVNDDELMAANGFERAHPDMTVDSEAIFALAELADSRAEVLEQLKGSMATAWMDERRPGLVFAARAVGRPLWAAWARQEFFFASTREALEVVEHALRRTFTKREVGEGTLLALADGRIARSERFAPDRSHVEQTALPAVRSAEEGAFCRRQLAAILAALT